MRCQPMGPGAFAILIDEEDLRRLRLTAGEVSPGDALRICADVTGQSVGGLRVELYQGRDSVMIFARRKAAFFYAFDSLGDAAAACASLPRGTKSSLYLDGERYVLRLSSPAAALTEFGDELDAPDSYRTYLDENAAVIVHDTAADTLGPLA